MADPTAATGDEHRALAIAANNSTWEYLDGRDHTPDDADELLQRAYAAAYHWKRATGATVVNSARAAWLISRAHSVLGHGELALRYAERSLQFVEQAGPLAADFDAAYAHEARARALACLSRREEASVAYELAQSATVADAQDRAVFEGDLAAEPWFGLDRL